MRQFSETAIRDRLKAKYRMRGRLNGRPQPNLEAAMRDVRACLREIEELRKIVVSVTLKTSYRMWQNDLPALVNGVKEGEV